MDITFTDLSLARAIYSTQATRRAVFKKHVLHIQRIPNTDVWEAGFTSSRETAVRRCQKPRESGEEEILCILEVVFKLITLASKPT
jgi:hypothetical protein